MHRPAGAAIDNPDASRSMPFLFKQMLSVCLSIWLYRVIARCALRVLHVEMTRTAGIGLVNGFSAGTGGTIFGWGWSYGQGAVDSSEGNVLILKGTDKQGAGRW